MTKTLSQQAPPLVLSLRNGSGNGASTSHDSTSPPPPASPTSSEYSDSPPIDPLRAQIASGLRGTGQETVPGTTADDRSFAFSKRIPTMVLYSEKGLQIYERITQTKAYYPFEAEKEILETYGDEIACRMFGLPTSLLEEGDKTDENGQDSIHESAQVASSKDGNERWGDSSVGLHNFGVNGGLGHSSAVPLARSGLAVELGSGSLDKTRHLLRSMAKLLRPRGKSSTKGLLDELEYKALDLEAASLYSTLSSLASIEGESVTTSLQDHIPTRRVSVSGLHATYDEGLAFLKEENARLTRRPSVTLSSPDISPAVHPERLPDVIDEEDEDEGDAAQSLPSQRPCAGSSNGARKTSIVWLGSSIGNFTREEAVDFLKEIDLAPGDTMLIGVDGCSDGPAIEIAYNDPEGVTRDFILEGVDVAGKTLHPDLEAGKGLCASNFDYVNRWNSGLGRHEAYIRAKSSLSIPLSHGSSGADEEVHVEEGELLQIEVSYKYTRAEALSLFHLAGFRLIQIWTDSSHRHSLYLVERQSVFFPSPNASKYLGLAQGDEAKNVYSVPSLDDWETMFRGWNWLMHDIIPASLRFTKPIPLRHVPLFYIGHAPAFRDIHLSRYFNEPLTSPAHFADIFERGIDPDVDDKTKINHWHSEVPQTEKDWPKLEEISAYEERVRDRVRRVYEEYEGKWERKMARVLMMVFEHEMMHFETSVYICLQACTKLNLPIGTSIPDFPSLARFDRRQIKHQQATSGEDRRNVRLRFERQKVEVGHDDREADDEVTAYQASQEFGWDCEHPKRTLEVAPFEISALPVSNGEYHEWLNSPAVDAEDRSKLVPASWTSGARGSEAVKTLWGEVEMKYASEWPVAASADQLEKFANGKGGRLPTQAELSLYLSKNPTDHPSSNIGLSNLHATMPTLATPARDGSYTPASNGGLWEWTSTILESWEGFEGSQLYPGYSSDFHDGKHRVVLGASWASPRRIARSSFVNFYQAAYPYALIGARIAYDV